VQKSPLVACRIELVVLKPVCTVRNLTEEHGPAYFCDMGTAVQCLGQVPEPARRACSLALAHLEIAVQDGEVSLNKGSQARLLRTYKLSPLTSEPQPCGSIQAALSQTH
jgi:hypothetical protein